MFAPPAQYASKANTAYESTLSIGSPLVAFVELISWAPSPMDVPQVPATHLLSPNNTEEFSAGMIKPGTIEFSGNFIGDASQLAILTLAEAQTIFPFAGVAPMQRGVKTYTGSGIGYFSKYSVGPFENNKDIQFKATIQITGAYSEAVV